MAVIFLSLLINQQVTQSDVCVGAIFVTARILLLEFVAYYLTRRSGGIQCRLVKKRRREG